MKQKVLSSLFLLMTMLLGVPLEAFADRQNWTVEKLFNYALTGLLAGIFFLVLAVFFVVGLIKSRKRKGGKKR